VVYSIEGNKEIMLDSFTYNKNFHNPLLPNNEGVSLERISLEKPINVAGNWQSAASSVGFATPAYQNSQFLSPSVLEADNTFFSIETPYFSPDGDGFQDVFLMQYKLDKDGYNGSFFIFDITGKLTKVLKTNELLALEGQVKWSGEDDKNLPALSGTYIFYANLISPKGAIKKWKKMFALTNKL
jgi:hypothetical protein